MMDYLLTLYAFRWVNQGYIMRERVAKEHLVQVILVITPVPVSRRVYIYHTARRKGGKQGR